MKRYLKIILILAIATTSFANGNKTAWSILHNSELRFTKNKGQLLNSAGKAEKDVLFISDAGAGTKIYFENNRIIYVQSKVEFEEENEEEEVKERAQPGYDLKKEQKEHRESAVHRHHRVDLEFVNANPNTQVLPEEQSKDYVNYYLPQC